MNAFSMFQQSPYFMHIQHAKLAQVSKHSTVCYFEDGQIVVRATFEQSHILYVHEGSLGIYRHDPERDMTLLLGRVCGPSIFGDMEASVGSAWTCTAYAENHVTLIAIPKAVFFDLIHDEPAVLERLYHDACVRHFLANHSNQVAVLFDIETKLLRLLLEYALQFGSVFESGLLIERPIAQIELAHALGVHRRTIARTVEQLEAQNLVQQMHDTKQWYLPNIEAIQKRLPNHVFGLSSKYGADAAPMCEMAIEDRLDHDYPRSNIHKGLS